MKENLLLEIFRQFVENLNKIVYIKLRMSNIR